MSLTMKMRLRVSWLARLVPGCSFLDMALGFAQEQEAEGGKDHPLISRYF